MYWLHFLFLDNFFFKCIQGDKAKNFVVEFEESGENYLFSKDLFELIGNQMITFKDGENVLIPPFFPESSSKIVLKSEGQERSFVLRIFESEFSLKPNDSYSAYSVHIVSPGTFLSFIVFFLFYFSVLLDSNSIQPSGFVHKITRPEEDVILRMDYHLNHGTTSKNTKFTKIKAKTLKNFIDSLLGEKVILKSDSDKFVKYCSVQSQTNDFVLDVFNDKSAIVGRVPMLSFMWLEIPANPPIGGFYDPLAALLTKPGNDQLQELEKILIGYKNLIEKTKTIYAPFTALIQSSGFGKTKLCLELLKKYPGLYLVFRRENDQGIPAMASWMKKFQAFVLDAPTDSIPTEESDLNNSRVGKFLIGLEILLTEYYKCMEALIKKLEDKTSRSRKSDKRIVLKAIEMFSEMFMKNPAKESEEESRIPFNPVFETSRKNVTSSYMTVQLQTIIQKICELLGESVFPFTIYFDELELMIHPITIGRASAVNVVRRALHLANLDSVNFMAVAIGTNSDALSFSPAIRDDSLRHVVKNNLLSTTFLTGNWDIFSNIIEYHKVELTVNQLKNRALFNVLVSFGRALWSSCGLADVVTIAETKLKNGNRNALGALLALLLVRADISVNTHHVLARNLIKSYMAIVSYVSTDANDIKIGYSSEPVLAMASRSLLKEKSSRTDCLLALKEFLEIGVIDKGRIVEALFEYVTLFALDDAPLDGSLYDDPSGVPEQFLQLANCKSHILEIVEVEKDDIEWEITEVEGSKTGQESIKEENLPEVVVPQEAVEAALSEQFDKSVKIGPEKEGEPLSTGIRPKLREFAALSYSDAKKLHYRVSTVENFLKSLLGEKRFFAIAPMIDSNLLKGIVNVSHYVQLEKMRVGDFENLKNVPSPEVTRKRVIDKALLVCGIMRQCGYVMPQNYYGFDFAVPFVFEDSETGKSLYSFIGIQSKTSKEDIFKCAVKMSADLHYCLCSNPGHAASGDQCRPEKKCTLFEEYQVICHNQISVLLIAEEPSSREITGHISLSLAGQDNLKITYDFPSNPDVQAPPKKSPERKVGKRKLEQSDTRAEKYPPASVFAKEAWKFESDLLAALPENQSIAGPYCKLTKYSGAVKKVLNPSKRPDAIIKKVVDNTLTALELLWNDPVAKDEQVEKSKIDAPVKKAKPSPADVSGATSTTLTASSATSTALPATPTTLPASEASSTNSPAISSPNPILLSSRRKHVCIVSRGFSSFNHFFDDKGKSVFRYILDFEASSFHNVDDLQLPLVQSAMLRGKFSPFYQVNPMLMRTKEMEEVGNPTEKLLERLTPNKYQDSVSNAINGPVDASVILRRLKLEKDEKNFLNGPIAERSEEESSCSETDSIYQYFSESEMEEYSD